MTKLLLSCDDSIYLHDGKYYVARIEQLNFYRRYLRVFDSIRLVTRCVIDEKLKDGSIALENEPRIEYVPVPEFHGPKQYARVYFKVGNALKNAVKGCDAAVLRIPSTVALRVGKTVLKQGLPYACEVVFDAQDGYQGSKGINRLAWKMIDKQMRLLCSMAEGVSCVTEKYLQQHYFPTSPNAFISNYSSLALPKEFYSNYRSFPQKDTLIIAHTANQVEFNGRKGQNEIIRAVSLLNKRNINVLLVFAGKDYNGGIEKLKAFAANLGVNNIDFTGYLNREELDCFLSDADLYVMPTKAEGLPRVIIEAMAKGLPCVTSPVSGNPELIDEHFLIPYADVELLADRIEELCINADLYEQTSRTNFERSKQYEANILQARRDEFYMNLKKRIM